MTGDRIRVGMNLLWLVPGVVGGTEDAACGILQAMRTAATPDLTMRLYAQRRFRTAHPTLATAFPTRTQRIPRDARLARVAIESTWLGQQARRDRLDVIHCFGGVVPSGLRTPAVLTLHDIQPLEAGAEVAPIKARWLARMIPRSVERAVVVMVPSTFVRDRLLAIVDADPDKVVVVPHGVDPVRPITHSLAPETLRARFRLDGPFVLYPAITYPHKNHLMLVEAFARLRADHPEALLVLTGGAGSSDHEVAAAVERFGIGASVRRLGRVSNAEIDALYRAATAVAYPSRYEGFGLPVLEALGAGTPVVAADAASMPEVLAGAGQLVGPDDSVGWAEALGRCFDGDPAVTKLVELGQSRAEACSWDKLVPMFVDVYRRVATQSRGEKR